MNYSIKLSDPRKQQSDCLIVGIFTKGILSAAAKKLDRQSGGRLTKLLKQGDLGDECGQTLLLHGLLKIPAKRVLLVQCGNPDEFNEASFRKVVSAATQALKQTPSQEASNYLIELALKNQDTPWKIRQTVAITSGIFYRFDQFKSQKKLPKRTLRKLVLVVADQEELKTAQQSLKEAHAIAAGVALSKDLGNTPANVCTPTYLAQQAQQLAEDYRTINTTIHDEKAIKKLSMGAFLAVARGSHEPARLIVLEYKGAVNTQKPIALVGKGVTFDSGGLSLKPAAGMEEMKYDMCGAASVLGVFKAVAELNLPLNLLGIIPATENLPGGSATKPGDIVTSLSGQTIEIMNTDAEGRLILADALTYSEKFNPEFVIDIATLTGAVVVALGSHASGLMGNHEPLINDLKNAGDKSWDRVWPLPLWEDYQEQISSNAADMSNVGANGGKPITAACFLARFTKKLKWAHLDIAGVAWQMGKDKAATGRPVGLLVQYLLDKCSK